MARASRRPLQAALLVLALSAPALGIVEFKPMPAVPSGTTYPPEFVEAFKNGDNAAGSDMEKAVAWYDRCLSIVPGAQNALNNKARAFYLGSKHEMALTTLGDAPGAVPEYFYFFNKGVVYIKMEKWREAYEMYNTLQSYAFAASDPDVQENMGYVKAKLEGGGAVACGNGRCDAAETAATCPMDCKAYCGNNLCEEALGESSDTCCKDCGCPNGFACADGAKCVERAEGGAPEGGGAQVVSVHSCPAALKDKGGEPCIAAGNVCVEIAVQDAVPMAELGAAEATYTLAAAQGMTGGISSFDVGASFTYAGRQACCSLMDLMISGSCGGREAVGAGEVFVVGLRGTFKGADGKERPMSFEAASSQGMTVVFRGSDGGKLTAAVPTNVGAPSECGDGRCDESVEGTTCCKDCPCPEGTRCDSASNRCVQQATPTPAPTEPPLCGNGRCDRLRRETSESCCRDCGCPTGMDCKDNKCVKPSGAAATASPTARPPATPTPSKKPSTTSAPTPTPPPADNGKPCTGPSQCQSGNCGGGVCCIAGRQCCDSNADCHETDRCDAERFYCVALKEEPGNATAPPSQDALKVEAEAELASLAPKVDELKARSPGASLAEVESLVARANERLSAGDGAEAYRLAMKARDALEEARKANKLDVGGACRSGDECQSGNCGNGVCCKAGMACCTKSSQCGVGELCDEERKFCASEPKGKMPIRERLAEKVADILEDPMQIATIVGAVVVGVGVGLYKLKGKLSSGGGGEEVATRYVAAPPAPPQAGGGWGPQPGYGPPQQGWPR